MGFFNSVIHTISDTLDPHLAQLEREYKSIVARYNSTRLQLVNDVNQFQGVLNDYREMAACNGTLLICGKVYNWEDSKFNSFLSDTKATPPLKKAGLLPGGISDFISKSTGSDNVVHFLINPVGADQFGLASVAQAMEVGGIGSVDSIVSEVANLASMGILGIGGAIIGNIIEGEIEIPKEIEHVDGMLNRLEQRIGQVNQATAQLHSGIQRERQGYLQTMGELSAIEKPTFNWQLSPGSPDTAYQTAMVKAVQQYGIIFRLRQDWKNFQGNNPSGTYEQFVMIENTIGRSGQYSAEQIKKFIWLIAEATQGGLHSAWVKAGQPKPA